MSEDDRSLWTFTGLTGVDLNNNPEVRLPDGFFLSTKTPQLLAALDEGYMGSIQRIWWTPRLDAFFCLRSEHSLPRNEEMERFQDGSMALQTVKPVQTLGLIFQADDYGGCFYRISVQERPQMSAGEWAELRRFDGKLIAQLDGARGSLRQQGSLEIQEEALRLLG